MRYLLLIVFLSGCGCNYHLKRIQKKCGVDRDTVYRTDTIFIPKVHTDSIFYYNQTDTVIVKEGRLTMRYFYHDSLVYLSGECDTVSVVKRYPVVVNKYQPVTSWITWVLVGALVAVLLTLFRRN